MAKRPNSTTAPSTDSQELQVLAPAVASAATVKPGVAKTKAMAVKPEMLDEEQVVSADTEALATLDQDIVLAQAPTSSTPAPSSVGEELLRQAVPVVPRGKATRADANDSNVLDGLFGKDWGMPMAIGGGVLGLVALGGKSNKSEPTPTPPAPELYTITVTPFAGAFNADASVKVTLQRLSSSGVWTDVVDSQVISTGSPGKLEVKLLKSEVKSTDIYRVLLQDRPGDDYTDEATNLPRTLGNKSFIAVIGALTPTTQNTISVTVNALTDLAATKMASDFSQNNIDAMNAAVAKAFAITPSAFLSTVPVVAGATSGSIDQKNYGYALGLISGMAKAQADAADAPGGTPITNSTAEVLALLATAPINTSNGTLDLSGLQLVTKNGVDVGLLAGAKKLADQIPSAAVASSATVATVASTETPSAEQTLVSGAANVSYYSFINGGLTLNVVPRSGLKAGDQVVLKLYKLGANDRVDTSAEPYRVTHTLTESELASFSLTIAPYYSQRTTDQISVDSNALGLNGAFQAKPSENGQYLLPVDSATGRYITDRTATHNYLMTVDTGATGLVSAGNKLSIASAPIVIETAPPVNIAPTFNATRTVTVDVVLPQKVIWGQAAEPTLTLNVTDALGVVHPIVAKLPKLNESAPSIESGDLLRFSVNLNAPENKGLEGTLSIPANALSFPVTDTELILSDVVGNDWLKRAAGSTTWTRNGVPVTDLAQVLLGESSQLTTSFKIDTAPPADPILNIASAALPALDPSGNGFAPAGVIPTANRFNAADLSAGPAFAKTAFTSNIKQQFTVTFDTPAPLTPLSMEKEVARGKVALFVNLVENGVVNSVSYKVAETTIALASSGSHYEANFTAADYIFATALDNIQRAVNASVSTIGKELVFSAQVIDGVGNASATVRIKGSNEGGLFDHFYLDTKAPATGALVLGSNQDTGLNTTDLVTNKNKPVLLVTGEANSYVQLYAGDAYVNDTSAPDIAHGYLDEFGQLTLPALTNALASGVQTLYAKFTDQAGNVTQRAANLSLDVMLPSTVPPAVAIVTNPSHSGYYKSGETIQASVTFDRAVFLSAGKNASTLAVGLIDDANKPLVARYKSGLGTPTLIFEYVLQNGDDSVTGYYLNPSDPLSGVNTVLEDLAGNQAPIAPNIVAGPGQIAQKVDTTPPLAPELDLVATVLSHGNAATATVAENGAVTVKSEAGVSVRVKFVNAADASKTVTKTITSATGGADLVTLSAADLTVLGEGTWNVSATAIDVASNTGPTSDAKSLRFDSQTPVIAGVTDNISAAVTNQAIEFTVTFNEALVAAPTAANFTATNGTVTGFAPVPGSTTQYKVTVQPASNILSGQVALSLVPNPAGATPLQDAAGNLVQPQSLEAYAQAIDTQGPVITAITPAASGAITNRTFDFMVTFNEMGPRALVGDLYAANFPVTNGTVTAVTRITDTQYKVTVTPLNPTGNSADLVLGFVANPGNSRVRDALRNDAVDVSDLSAVGGKQTVDAQMPSIISSGVVVASATGGAAGHYKAGDVVTATVTLDEAVVVTGVPTLGLTLDNAVRTATYSGISANGKTLSFTYTLVSGDTDANGIAIAANALTLSAGASIKDFAGNNAVINYASVADNASFVVDTVIPTIGSVSIASATNGIGGLYKAGDVVTVAVPFSEAVTVTGVPTVALTIGTTARVATYASTSADGRTLNFTYTIAAGDNDANGIAITALTLPSGASIKDAAGNDATITPAVAADNALFKVDTTAPTVASVAIDSATGGGSGIYKAGDVVTFVATLSESAVVAGVPTLGLMVGSTPRTATYSSTDGNKVKFTYTIAADDADANGIAILGNTAALAAGSIKDAAGNDAVWSYSEAVDNAAFKVDNVAPTLVSFGSTSVDKTYKIGETIDIRATVSEALRPNATLTVVLNSGKSVLLTRSATDATLLTGTYTVAEGESSADLTINSYAVGANVSDLAGNALLAATVPTGTLNIGGSKAIVVDGVSPPAPTLFRLTPASDLGLSSEDGFTSVTRPSFLFEGLEVGATVKVYASSGGTENLVFSFVATATNQSYTTPANWAEGTYTNVRVQQTDAIGNVGVATVLSNVATAGRLIISTQAPATLANLQFDAVQDTLTESQYNAALISGVFTTGSAGRDNNTTIQTPRFNFTGGVNGNVALLFRDLNSNNQYDAADELLGSKLINNASSTTISSVGAANYVDVSVEHALPNAIYTDIKVVQQSAGGVLGAVSGAASVRVQKSDTTVAALTAVNTAEIAAVSNSTTMSFNVTGVRAGGATVKVLADSATATGVVLGSAWLSVDGTLTIDVSAYSGAYHNFNLTQTYAGVTSAVTPVISNSTNTSFGTITWDRSLPSVVVELANSAAHPNVGDAVNVKFTFSTDPGSSFDLATDLTVVGGTLSGLAGSGVVRTATFTPTDASVTDATITVKAGSYQSSVGNLGQASTPLNVAYNTLPVGLPTITGAVTQNQTLTADTSGLSDVNGLGSLTYVWKADGSPIAGANSRTFSLTQAQVGKAISVDVSYTDGRGASELVHSAPTSAVTDVNDVATGSVTITGGSGTAGAPKQGDTLTATNSLVDLDGIVGGVVSYQWQANGLDIAGATGASLALAQAQVGQTITVKANYTDSFGAQTVNSAATVAVADVLFAPTGSVTITNSGVANAPKQGDVLTASNTLADADGMGVVSYQWFDGGSSPIASGSTLTLAQSQVGKVITVKASYTDGQNASESVLSSPTSSVANVNDPVSGTVTVSGTFEVGQTLTASSALSDPDGIPANGISYTWYATAAGGTPTEITGSRVTGTAHNQLVLTSDLVGQTLSVKATYVDNNGGAGTGAAEELTSSSTPTVAWPTSISVGALSFATDPSFGGLASTSNAQLILGHGGDYVLDVNGDGLINASDATTYIASLNANGELLLSTSNLKLSLFSATDPAWAKLNTDFSDWGLAGTKALPGATVAGSDFWTSTPGAPSTHKVWSISAAGVVDLYDKTDTGSYSGDISGLHYNVFHVAAVLPV